MSRIPGTATVIQRVLHGGETLQSPPKEYHTQSLSNNDLRLQQDSSNVLCMGLVKLRLIQTHLLLDLSVYFDRLLCDVVKSHAE